MGGVFASGTAFTRREAGGSALTSPLTTKGDLWGYSTTDDRVPVGADGTFLVADSTQALGVRYRALTDADIPNTITLDNLTQITTRNHSSLQNLTTGDDHTQYMALGGRAGATNNPVISSNSTGTITGSNALNANMAVKANANASSISGEVHVQGSVVLIERLNLAVSDVIFKIADVTSSFLTGLRTSSSGVTQTYTFPLTAGAGFMKHDGAGNLSWSTVTAADIGSGQALTRTNDTNVTVTLGGSPTTALLAATSLTLGWTGQLGVSRGGTAADLSATGGTSQVLKQTSVGGAVSVAQLAFTDISSTVSAAQGVLFTALAGRTGTTNNTILSTTTDGTLTGSTTTGKALILLSNSASHDNYILFGQTTFATAFASIDLTNSEFRTLNGKILSAWSTTQDYIGLVASSPVGILQWYGGSVENARIDNGGSSNKMRLASLGGFGFFASLALSTEVATISTAGNFTAIGGTHALGTTGTNCTLTVGQGTTGADLATVAINSGTGANPHLRFQANGTTGLHLSSSGFGQGQYGASGGAHLFYSDDTLVTNTFTIAGGTGRITRYANIATAGSGTAPIYAAALSGTQTGAATIVTYTPPATAGRYRISAVIASTSSTNSGTVQFQLDYTNSQGVGVSNSVIPLLTDNATAFAATGTGASREHRMATVDITINNAAANIVVKVAVTGTVSYTAAAQIEQMA